MTSHNKRFPVFGAAAAVCALLGTGLSGCGSSSEPQASITPVRRAPAPPPPPARSSVTAVAELSAQMGIDERVQLREEKAPGSDPARTAVLEFFDSFARGDDTALGSMLSGLDRDELESLVDSGAWAETTSQIIQIDVETGRSPDGQACVFARFYVADDFHPQLWYYAVEADGARFDAVAAPPNMMDRLYGDDPIAIWFEILEQELALADKPDEEFVVPQKDLSDSDRGGYSGPSSSPAPSGPKNPLRPSGPGGPPGKRKKKGKRPAPGKGELPW
jgi:hypothetical protein